MALELLSVGKPRQVGLAEAADEYASRLKRYTKFSESSVREERAGKGVERAEVLRKEGERLLSRLKPGSHVVVLDRSGKNLSSEDLAKRIDQTASTGTDSVFVIGGAFGLSDDVLKRANWTWQLSGLTYPHELARVVVLEQLYRAYTILRGEPYHK